MPFSGGVQDGGETVHAFFDGELTGILFHKSGQDDLNFIPKTELAAPVLANKRVGKLFEERRITDGITESAVMIGEHSRRFHLLIEPFEQRRFSLSPVVKDESRCHNEEQEE